MVRLANATQYGLASYFYTKDLGRAFRVAEALEYGMVGINSAILGTEVAPFGGVKESGLGREGGKHGMDEFVEHKYMLVGGLGEIAEGGRRHAVRHGLRPTASTSIPPASSRPALRRSGG